MKIIILALIFILLSPGMGMNAIQQSSGTHYQVHDIERLENGTCIFFVDQTVIKWLDPSPGVIFAAWGGD